MSLIPKPPTFTFITMEGCGGCEATRPEVAKVRELLKSLGMTFEEVDITKRQVKIAVPYTPAFHLQFHSPPRAYAIDAHQLTTKPVDRTLDAEGICWWIRSSFAHYVDWRQSPEAQERL